MGVAPDVGADDGILGILEDAAHRAGGGSAEGVVDVLLADGLFQVGYEVGYRAHRGGDAVGDAVQLAVQFGQHYAHGAGGAGAGGDDVLRRRPGAPQIPVVAVQKALVVGVGVDGGHQPAFYAESIVQHLDHGGKAVGGAGGVGDDAVRGVVQDGVVDADDDGGVGAAGRGGDDDLAGAAAADVRRRFGGVGEAAGAFHDDVHAHFGPGDAGRVVFLEHTDGFAVHQQVVVDGGGAAGVGAVGAVVLEEVGGGSGVADAVDGHQIQAVMVGGGEGGPGDQASDASESVNADARHHFSVCLP